MALVSSPLAMRGALFHRDSDDDEDEVLEDAGFFGGSSQPYDAQRALNELGLQPSPPKRSLYYDEEENDMPFDLDQVLAAEEEQESELEVLPEETAGVVAEDDDLLESNGLLQGSDTPVISTPPVVPSPLVVPGHHHSRPQAKTSERASSSRVQLIAPSSEGSGFIEQALGVNGLPKYIASGTTTATLLDGTTIRFEKRRRMKGWKPRPAQYDLGPGGLLSQPVHQIVDQVEAMSALQVVQQNEGLARPIRPKKTAEMWQERYRPQRFTDLIGEERTHRDVIRWLKEWDACVFGKKAQLRKKWKKEGEESEVVVYSDKWSRPKDRILLLGGPAGMGKTTLAHVVAKQCGYVVHEINASDDRSASTVEDRVRNALESRSLNQSSRLPTCLVLDEVDGATGNRAEEGGGFIKALIKLVERGSGTSKKGSKKQAPLLRPIICICNDPFAPNLRALRPYSRFIRVSRPSTPLLLNRLKHICETEKIAADSKSLNTLVDNCQGDIRSCLNVLQLIQNDHGGLSSASATNQRNAFQEKMESALGLKDSHSSIHQIWSSLFQTLTTREKAQKRGHSQRNKTDQEEMAELVGKIMGSGEMDKILGGCFEHYPSLKLVDDGWWRFKKMHDWIYWYEHIDRRSWQVGAQAEMWSYLPWSLVGWKTFFANTGNELPEYPRVDYQNHLKRTAFESVAADLAACLPVTTRKHFDSLSIVTELGPLLVTLLSPDVKLINSQLVRPEERGTLTRLVDIMHHCNLHFVLDKNEQGQSYYRMEPPLEVFVQFEGKKSLFVGPAKFQLRQMVVGELHAAKVKARREHAGEQEGDSKGAERQVGQTFKDAYSKRHGMTDITGQKNRIAVDFFGRAIVPKAVTAAAAAAPVSLVLPDSILGRRKEKENDEEEVRKRCKLKVFYNYHEGYSNAVRKPVKMSSLLT